MQDIENTYISMSGGTDAMKNHSPAFTRQWLKDKILSELPGVKSVRQKNMRSPAVLYCPEACETDMVDTAIRTQDDDTNDMKTLYQAAKLIRQRIEEFTKIVKPSSSSTIPVYSTLKDVPIEVYTLMRWITVGPADKLETEVRTNVVHKNALTLSQNLMFGFRSTRQIMYKPADESAGFRSQQAQENPQVVGLALSVHHYTRNKRLLDLLHAQGYCVSYSRTLALETALANAVVENTKRFQGLYIPPFLKKGTFLFFAADNTDFLEDTPDGKNTTHGTITTIFQKADPEGEPISPDLCLDSTKSKCLTVTPYHTYILPCDKPRVTAFQERTLPFSTSISGVSDSYHLTHLGWVLASHLSRMKNGASSHIPGWAGYNSFLSECRSNGA